MDMRTPSRRVLAGISNRKEDVWMAEVEIWFRVRCRVVSRKLDESSALRWMTGTKG